VQTDRLEQNSHQPRRHYPGMSIVMGLGPQLGTHDHEHARLAGRGLLGALALTLGFAAVEALAGWWAGSLALLSDAGRMVTDSASLALAALTSWLIRRPPSNLHSYGLGRAEIVAASSNAVFMLVVVVAISVNAIHRLRSPQPCMR
jgi:cobalt-zinc-cadmium efflux system protein